MKKNLLGGVVAASTLIAALSAAPASAQDTNDRGFYIGGGVGQFNLKYDGINSLDTNIRRLDDDDTAWTAFIGYRFIPWLAIEAAYVDFGTPSQDATAANGSNGRYDVSISGFQPSLVATMPLGPVEIFARAGYLFYNSDISANFNLNNLGVDSSSSDSDFVYGAGVGMTFFQHLNARLEWNKLDTGQGRDADALWLTGAWRF